MKFKLTKNIDGGFELKRVREGEPYFTDIKPARPGDYILLTMPHYWGKGPTISEAYAKLRSAGGELGKYWRVHSVHESTTVDGMGYINHPQDHAPVMLAESNPSAK